MAMTRQERLDQAAKVAVEEERKSGVPADLALAQWAMESGWGEHAPGNNYHGIKRAARHKEGVTVETKEVVKQTDSVLAKPGVTVLNYLPNGMVEVMVPRSEFARFDNIEGSFADYAYIVSQVYTKAWGQYEITRDLENLARAVAAKYATSPSYFILLWKILKQTNIQDALRRSREQLK